MRVIHVVPAVTQEASGPSYSVVRLCQSLVEAGVDLTLTAMDWSPLPSRPAFIKIFPLGFGPRRLGHSPSMCRWLQDEAAAGKVDVIHNHGMWQMNAVYPGWAAKDGKAKLVVSPRGAFSVWAMSYGSWLKKIFWPLIQRPALAHASCFHATSDAEYENIRSLGFKQPVAIIPNGIDVPEFVPKTKRDMRTLLFLGRIHPVKGVDVLLRAWAEVSGRFADWRLLVVGTDAGYSAQSGYLGEMKALATQLELKRVEFVDPLYGEAKWSAYRQAELFALPTHSENFGITVAEALAAGTPAIVTKGAPWSELDTHQAGWWIDSGVEALVDGLKTAMALSPEELARRGTNGSGWMAREFSWDTIGNRMHRTYRWLSEGGPVPSWVRLN